MPQIEGILKRTNNKKKYFIKKSTDFVHYDPLSAFELLINQINRTITLKFLCLDEKNILLIFTLKHAVNIIITRDKFQFSNKYFYLLKHFY